MITALLVGEAEVAANLDGVGASFRIELAKGIGVLAIKLQRLVMESKLNGQVLKVKTGRLRRSIKEIVEENGDRISGVVSTNVVYGIGWETGWADIGPRKSLKAAKAKFAVGDGTSFANGTPKERSFLRSALKDLNESGLIKSEIDAAIGRATA